MNRPAVSNFIASQFASLWLPDGWGGLAKPLTSTLSESFTLGRPGMPRARGPRKATGAGGLDPLSKPEPIYLVLAHCKTAMTPHHLQISVALIGFRSGNELWGFNMLSGETLAVLPSRC